VQSCAQRCVSTPSMPTPDLNRSNSAREPLSAKRAAGSGLCSSTRSNAFNHLKCEGAQIGVQVREMHEAYPHRHVWKCGAYTSMSAA
jgi:hypothetical protein